MSAYSIREYNRRLWVQYQGRLVGAVSYTGLRTYAHPFYTPNGSSVLQESPADHPHHHGLMVGQDLVNGHNFWTIQGRGTPNLQHVEATRQTLTDEDAEIDQDLVWMTADGQQVIRESRRTSISVHTGFNFIDIRSTLSAAFGPVHFGQTKEGGIGLRVHEQLESCWGGSIRSSGGKTGEKGVFDTLADWIEVYGTVGGQPVGVALIVPPDQPRAPWFVRDYGLHLYGPRRHSPLALAAGASVTLRVGCAAYDGPPERSQAAAAAAWYNRQPA